MEQELLTLPEHPSLSPAGFYLGSCYSISSFMCMFCRSLFLLLYLFFWPLCCLFFFWPLCCLFFFWPLCCLFFFWPLCCLFFCLLAIVLSVLRFTDVDCHFGIFRIFLYIEYFWLIEYKQPYLFIIKSIHRLMTCKDNVHITWTRKGNVKKKNNLVLVHCP